LKPEKVVVVVQRVVQRGHQAPTKALHGVLVLPINGAHLLAHGQNQSRRLLLENPIHTINSQAV